MARRKPPWSGIKTLALICGFLLCFSILPIIASALTASLALVVAYTPLFSMTTIFSVLFAILIRLQCVTEVPQNTLGVLVDRNGEFKALLAPAKYWLMPGTERIKGCLSLESTSAQMPLLKLKASDGEVSAQVVILIWRMRADMDKLLLSQYRQQVETMAVTSQQKREQFVRDSVEVVIRQQLEQRTVRQVEAALADKLGRPLQEAVIQQVNPHLLRVGLHVDQIEFVGATSTVGQAAFTSSKVAEEARKLIAGARQKLEQVLQPAAPPNTLQEVMQSGRRAHQLASQVRQDVNAISEAINSYIIAVSGAFGPLYRQAKSRPDLAPLERARQESFERLNQLQQDIGTLGQRLILLDQKVSDLPAAPFGLTPGECDRLFEVLDAIERKVIKLDTLYI